MYESSIHLECPVTYTDAQDVITDAIWSKIKKFSKFIISMFILAPAVLFCLHIILAYPEQTVVSMTMKE